MKHVICILWSEILRKATRLSLNTKQRVECRQDLARLEAGAPNDQARASFDKLIGFLDGAIQHAIDCEGNHCGRSRTDLNWHRND